MRQLSTERLIIRSFISADLPAVHRLFIDLGWADGESEEASLAHASAWLTWNAMSDEQHARLLQPPLGDRAVILASTGELVGTCGFNMSLGQFARLSTFGGASGAAEALRRCNRPELALFYAITPTQRLKGYAAEAARALVAFAFNDLRVERVVATTEYDNAGSMAVMRKLGMKIEIAHDAGWLQVAGVLEYTA